MTLKELKQEIKGVIKPPILKYYIGKLRYGTPYFYPRNFNENILSVRKLVLKSPEQYHDYIEKYPHLIKHQATKFTNVPMARRCKDWIIKLFGDYYFIQIGWPFSVRTNELGWKDKFNSPRFEWCPAFYIFFFKWQFCIHWVAPDEDNDNYYEMILQYLYYKGKDIKRVEKDWGWRDSQGKSTWNKDYLYDNSN